MGSGRRKAMRAEAGRGNREKAGSEMERGDIEILFEKAEALRNWPGSYFPALQRAQAALKDWRESHPGEAAEEDRLLADHQAREQARKDEEYRTGFIGRHID